MISRCDLSFVDLSSHLGEDRFRSLTNNAFRLSIGLPLLPYVHLTRPNPPPPRWRNKNYCLGSWREFAAGGFLGWHLTFM